MWKVNACRGILRGFGRAMLRRNVSDFTIEGGSILVIKVDWWDNMIEVRWIWPPCSLFCGYYCMKYFDLFLWILVHEILWSFLWILLHEILWSFLWILLHEILWFFVWILLHEILWYFLWILLHEILWYFLWILLHEILWFFVWILLHEILWYFLWILLYEILLYFLWILLHEILWSFLISMKYCGLTAFCLHFWINWTFILCQQCQLK